MQKNLNSVYQSGYEVRRALLVGGRLRAPPVADKASKKEWQRSKFCEATSERKISGTLAGHNGADSKGSRAYHSATCKSSRFLAISLKCFIFLEFWMTAFHFRPCKSRAKFKNNFICRGIEAVITGLTRNQFVDNTTRGFESLPLRQTEKGTLWSALFCLTQSVRIEPCSQGERGFAFERKPSGSWLTGGEAKNLRRRRISLSITLHLGGVYY